MNSLFSRITKAWSSRICCWGIQLLMLGCCLVSGAASAATFTATTGLWSAAGTWSGCGGGLPGNDFVVIPNGATVTLDVNTGLINDLKVNAGGVLQGDNTNKILTINKGGGVDITNNGQIQFGAGKLATISTRKNSQWTGGGIWNLSVIDLATKTLTFASALTIDMSGAAAPIVNAGIVTSLSTVSWNFSGAVAQTLPASTLVVYGDVTVSNTAGVTLGVALTATNVLGNLTVASGGILNNAGLAVTLAANKNFAVNAGGRFNLTGTSTMVTVSGGGTKTFNATSTVDYAGANQAVSAETYGNLILSGSGTKTMPAGMTTIAGNLNVIAVTYLGTTNNPLVNLAGNFSNTGTFTSGTGLFTLNGSAVAAQIVSGTPTFANLRINNTGGGVTLSNNATVSTVLTLTSGNVTTGANTFITSANCPGSISRSGGFIIGNLRLSFPAGTTSCTYPVGSGTSYAPIVISMTASAPGTLTGSTTAGEHPQIGTSGINPSKNANRYWNLWATGDAITATSYSPTFNFVASDLDVGATTASFIVGKYAGAAWTLPTPVTPTASSTAVTGITGGIAGATSFVVGEPGVHHYELSLPASGVACLASTVTVTACADSSSPCTSNYTAVSGTTATLATNAGSLGSTTVTFNASGVATTTLSFPAAANGATAAVTLSGEQTAAANPRKCCQAGVCAVANSCTETFNTAGFIFSASAGGAVATIPAQTAGTASAPITCGR